MSLEREIYLQRSPFESEKFLPLIYCIIHSVVRKIASLSNEKKAHALNYKFVKTIWASIVWRPEKTRTEIYDNSKRAKSFSSLRKKSSFSQFEGDSIICLGRRWCAKKRHSSSFHKLIDRTYVRGQKQLKSRNIGKYKYVSWKMIAGSTAQIMVEKEMQVQFVVEGDVGRTLINWLLIGAHS